MASKAKAVHRWTTISTVLFSILGMLVSIYALYVEINAHTIKGYKALCDLSEIISCSKVFTSRYGTGFGLIGPLLGEDNILNQPNSVFGMTFFLLQALLAVYNTYTTAWLQLFTAILASLGCVYLAYILCIILQDICIVCFSSYVITFGLLIVAVYKFRTIKDLEAGRLQSKKQK